MHTYMLIFLVSVLCSSKTMTGDVIWRWNIPSRSKSAVSWFFLDDPAFLDSSCCFLPFLFVYPWTTPHIFFTCSCDTNVELEFSWLFCLLPLLFCCFRIPFLTPPTSQDRAHPANFNPTPGEKCKPKMQHMQNVNHKSAWSSLEVFI